MLAITLSLALGPFLFFGSALIVAFTGYVVYQCFSSPIAAFPGPFAAKFTKIWRAYATYRGQWHREIVELHRQYGNVVRIGPNELSVGDPEAFRTIYRVNGAFVKSACYAVLQGSRPFDLTGERNEKIHSAQRRLVARPYSMESVVYLERQVTHLIDDLLIKFDTFASSSRSIDIGNWFQLFAFDVIGAVSFTKPFGFVAKANDDGMLTRIERSLGNTAWLMHVPWLFNFHQKYILPVFGNFLRANDRNNFFFKFAKSEVQDRRDKGGNDNDLLNDLVISFMMASNVFAGSDTTSLALRGIFLNLLRHPHVLSKLRAELEEQRAAGRLSSPVTFQEAEACPYLQAIMHEALRIFSPVGFNPDRDVPKEGMTINGIFVPGGTVVGSNAWVIHRMPEVWGADFEEFRPERWLERESSGELKRFFFAFGGGTRTCIGKNISWLEIGKLVATLVMRYDFQLVDDANITESCR
ncbi:hypothetical protein CI102_1839 [Trichoderma harzianum]|nr:hypothetical protein CI102_1839 [Trichoderma harzianum]